MTTDVFQILCQGLTPAYDRGMERMTLRLFPHSDGTLHTNYGFQTYLDRYGRLPDSPRYVLAPQQANGEPRVVRVWFTREPGAGEKFVDVAVPAGWPAGHGLAVELPGRAAEQTHQLRLTRLQPLGPASQSAQDWQVTALLGNLAKLLWTIGRDYEELAWRIEDVAAQRHAHRAKGASLDLIGQDLGAPRFPPRPHTWDEQTIALYHLNDRPPPVTQADGEPEVREVREEGAAFGASGHPGINAGARSGRTGRFSSAFEFSGSAGITVEDSPDFAVGPDASLTVEAVVQPNRRTSQLGAIIAKRAALSLAAAPGWSLTVGGFHGVERNLRLSVSDGTTEVELFADRDLGDGAFHHVAAVVERPHETTDQSATPHEPSTVVRLYVDGENVSRRRVDRLGALSNNEPMIFGLGRESPDAAAADAQYAGLLEEVRISRTARTSFEPVTGESDGHYRIRLGLFQRWLVPTLEALQQALDAAGPVEIDEAADRPAVGLLGLRVLPARLCMGQNIAADGDQRISEAGAVGSPEDEPDFDPSWLGRHDDRPGRLGFAAGEDTRLMQLCVRLPLDALLDRTDDRPGTLTVLRAYDGAAADLHRVGRALLLRHDTLTTDELGVHAHAAGFGWVQHTRDGLLRTVGAPGPTFRIILETPHQHIRTGEDVTLSLDPDPCRLPGAEVRWSVTRSGPGDATVGRAGEDAHPDHRGGRRLPGGRDSLEAHGVPAILHAAAAGEVTIQAEVTHTGHTRSCSRVLRIGLADGGLASGESVSRTGVLGVTETQAAGPRTDSFRESHLLVRTDDLLGTRTAIDYGTELDNRRMQHVTAVALDRLLDLLTEQSGTLTVLKAYDPSDPGLHGQGRALMLRHSALSTGELSARAFDTGVDFVQAAPAGPPPEANAVAIAVAQGEQIEVSGPTELRVDEIATIGATPRVAPEDACFAPDGTRVYLSAPGSHRVTSLAVAASPPEDFPRPTLASSRPVLPFPGPLALVGGRLYVAHRLSDAVSVLDPGTLESAAPALTGPRPVALGTDGSQLLVAYAGDSTLRAYDPTRQEPTDSVTLPGVPRAIAVNIESPRLAVLLDGGRFCRVARDGLDLQGGVIGTRPDTEAVTAAFGADGTKLYIALRTRTADGETGSVQVYTSESTTPVAVVDGFPAGTVPLALCSAPDGGHLYVATAGSAAAAGRVHVIDTAVDVLLPQVLTPDGDCRAVAVAPASAQYRPCLLAAPESTASVLLADPAPLGRTPPQPPRLVSRLPLGAGGGEELTWSLPPSGRGQVEFVAQDSPVNQVKGRTPGVATIRADYLPSGGLWPYQCEVRLRQGLDDVNASISKDSYDLVLNILNWFHPVGVEFRTDRLREHVRELSGDPADTDLLPAYTFPTYHRTDRITPRFPRPDKDGAP